MLAGTVVDRAQPGDRAGIELRVLIRKGFAQAPFEWIGHLA